MAHCEDCGTRMSGGRCPNCHEELFILDQYDEMNIPRPDYDSEFMRRAREQEKQTAHAVQNTKESEAKERNRQRWPEQY